MLIETERLILRKLREEDFADYCEFALDLEASRMMGRAEMRTVNDARINFNYLHNFADCCAIVLKGNGKVIGNLTLSDPPPNVLAMNEVQGKTGRSMSFCISRPYQRRGLMLEAVKGVIDHLFHAEGMDYVNCGYLDFNEPSRRLQEKLGFTCLTKESFDLNGENITAIENILWNAQKDSLAL